MTAWLVPLCLGPSACLPLNKIAVAIGKLWTTSLAFIAVSSAALLLAGFVSWHLFERYLLELERYFEA